MAEDMADYYGDIVTRYPAIMCIIDPIRKEVSFEFCVA